MTITEINLKHWFTRAFIAFIVICPVIWLAKGNFGMATMRVDQQQAFQIGGILFTGIFIIENLYISAFLALSVANYIHHNFSGSEYLLNILLGSLVYQITYKITDDNVIEAMFKAILILCAVNLLWDFANRIGYEPLFRNFADHNYGSMKGVGLMGLKCFYGMLFAIAIPFALYYNWWSWPLFFIPMYLSESSAAIGGGIIAVLIHFWFQSKRVFAILLIIMGISGGYFIYKDSKTLMFIDRADLWITVIRDGMKKPFMGWGMDSFRNIRMDGQKDFMYMKNTQTGKSFHAIIVPETGEIIIPNDQRESLKNGGNLDPWDHPHNEYVMAFFQYGFPLMIIIGLLFRDIWQRLNWYDSRQRACFGFLSVIAVISFAHFPFHVVRLGIFVPAILGVYYHLTDKESQLA